MKKLFTLIFLLSLIFGLQAQDITNQVGSSGNFKINKSDGSTNLFTLSDTDDHLMRLSASQSAFTVLNSDGEAILELDDALNYLEFSMLKLGFADENWDTDNFAHLQLQGAGVAPNELKMISRGVNNYIGGYYARGTASAPADVQDGDALIGLEGFGYNKGFLRRKAAAIQFKVDGNPGEIEVPGKIVFYTSTASSETIERMNIRSDGTINIVGLATGGANEALYVDEFGNLTTASTTPNLSELNTKIELLKEENNGLKTRLEELESKLQVLLR